MPRPDLLSILDRLAHPRVLVLGDVMLDRYTFGNAERISQEAPIIVLSARERETRLGGAANVCHMLRGLEAEVTCAAVVGDDEAGTALRKLLEGAGIDHALLLVDPSRPTTLKERFVGRASAKHPSQILRVDTESTDPLPEPIEARLMAGLVARLAECDVLLISDYSKGVCTPRLLRAAIDAARLAGVPVLVDPLRDGSFDRYHGATVLKPNRREAEQATGAKIGSPEAAFEVGARLCQELQLEAAVITLDRDGMALVQADGQGEIYPTEAREVYDITGAGDMVLAMLGLCWGSGIAAEDAVRLGNVAGGLEVEQAGVAVIPRAEIRTHLLAAQGASPRKVVTCEEAAGLAEQLRKRGKRIVFTNGCFDLLHVGHVTYLAEAAALGDVLFVGLNSDASVSRLKGPQRPVINERDRAALLAALACVGHVVVFDEPTPHRLLRAIRPDVLVKGGTYTPDEVVGHELVESYGGRVCVTGMVDGISTTKIVESLTRTAPSELRRAG